MSGDEGEGLSEFETDLAALEERVASLAEGTLPLDEAVRVFEEGVALYQKCHEALARAEQRVTKVVEGLDGAADEVPLDIDTR